jgi:hypothetical protein
VFVTTTMLLGLGVAVIAGSPTFPVGQGRMGNRRRRRVVFCDGAL